MDYDHQVSQMRDRVRGLRKGLALILAEIEAMESHMDTMRRWDDEAMSRRRAELAKAAAAAEPKPADG